MGETALDAPLPTTPAEVMDEAGRLAAMVTDRFPNDPDAFEIEARIHFWLGDSAAAEQCWRRCLELSSSYAYAYHGLGLAAARRGDHAEAATLFQKALEIAPASIEPRMELAAALANSGRWNDAVAALEPNLPSMPNKVPALMLLGRAYQHLDRPADAKRCYETALQSVPRDSNAWFGLGTACARLGLGDEARRAMEQFRQLREDERKERQARQGSYDDLGAMREALAAQYTTAGDVFAGDGRGREGERLWRRAAYLAPKDVGCRERLARTLVQSGRLAEAVVYLEQLSAIDPANPAYAAELRRIRAIVATTPSPRKKSP